MDADDRISVETLIRRARVAACPSHSCDGSAMPTCLSQSAALAFYALLSLAPLLLILLWITASALAHVHASRCWSRSGCWWARTPLRVARVIISNADARPDTGSIAGVWSLILLLVGATASVRPTAGRR